MNHFQFLGELMRTSGIIGEDYRMGCHVLAKATTQLRQQQSPLRS